MRLPPHPTRAPALIVARSGAGRKQRATTGGLANKDDCPTAGPNRADTSDEGADRCISPARLDSHEVHHVAVSRSSQSKARSIQVHLSRTRRRDPSRVRWLPGPAPPPVADRDIPCGFAARQPDRAPALFRPCPQAHRLPRLCSRDASRERKREIRDGGRRHGRQQGHCSVEFERLKTASRHGDVLRPATAPAPASAERTTRFGRLIAADDAAGATRACARTRPDRVTKARIQSGTRCRPGRSCARRRGGNEAVSRDRKARSSCNRHRPPTAAREPGPGRRRSRALPPSGPASRKPDRSRPRRCGCAEYLLLFATGTRPSGARR